MDTNSPIEMALMYAGKGWHVFPLHTVIDGTTCDCRRSCPKPGKHPRTANGFKDATTDETQIRKWWGMWPDANIGIATGKVSNMVVIDVDPRNGGEETMRGFIETHGPLPRGPMVKTPNGRHHYFNYSEGLKCGLLGPGVDFKGDGGYVVAPPSKGIEL